MPAVTLPLLDRIVHGLAQVKRSSQSMLVSQAPLTLACSENETWHAASRAEYHTARFTKRLAWLQSRCELKAHSMGSISWAEDRKSRVTKDEDKIYYDGDISLFMSSWPVWDVVLVFGGSRVSRGDTNTSNNIEGVTLRG